ncbi:MAG: NAD(P)H-quinone oxidoreductase subunit 2, chloroplastic [Phycisphaerae bacterium]|nr:NAD(P)H-quinone oxidoreductase subunit 2, chloroplastic [Phycisphaerae bacterium]
MFDDVNPMIWMLTAATLLPLGGFVVLILLGKRMGRALAGWFGTAVIGTSAVLALLVAKRWMGLGEHAAVADLIIPWLQLKENLVLSVGVHVDGLTVAMTVMVTIVATMIHLFSVGYMWDDVRFSRFFAFLNLFCFSMLGLIVGNTLITMFVFWELVGLCSYLLIGFYFEKKSASNAAIKAFVVNRIGDFGFILGIAGAFFWLAREASAGSHGVINLTISQMNHIGSGLLAAPGGAPLWLTAIGLLLFCGAVGKSAQFPLHVWLPDAMEGPTPVSALIHAATMVAAGVYMVGRIFDLLTPQALLVIAAIGLITLTMAALIAITQFDIKRVLAYSTLSQLGYMVMGIGLGGYVAGLFHLITHAFFKSLLFLGSGAVIHACHHEQDMRKMGGLFRAIPITAITFIIATFAISGLPFVTSGFYSKDMILGNAWDYASGARTVHSTHAESAGEHGGEATAAETPTAEHGGEAGEGETAAFHAPALNRQTIGAGRAWAWMFFWIPLVIAYVTAFYMFRAVMLTFFTRPRDEHVFHHAKEHGVPWKMKIPLIVLAAGAIVVGFPQLKFVGWIESTRPAEAWGLQISHAAHGFLFVWAGIAFAVGGGLAVLIYRNGFGLATKIRRLPGVEPIYQVVYNKFYVDELYNHVLLKLTMAACQVSYFWDKWVIDGLVNVVGTTVRSVAEFSGMFDRHVIDGSANGLAAVTQGAGRLVRVPQTGRIRNYVLFMVLTVLLAVGVFLTVRMVQNGMLG